MGGTKEQMSSPDQDGLVAALKALTAEIKLLRSALENRSAGSESEPLAASPGETAEAGNEEEAVQEAQGALEEKAAQEADAFSAAVHQVLVAVLMSALDSDEEQGFDSFLTLVHTSRMSAPQSVPSIRQFTWKSLRKNVCEYLADADDPTSYAIVRQDPPELTRDDSSVKIYLGGTRRSPTPITFQCDSDQGNAWRVTDSSL